MSEQLSMGSHANWSSRADVLTQPSRCNHAAHLFCDDQSLCSALELYIGNALRRGNGAIVVATMEHVDHLMLRLMQSGIDVAAARNSAQLVFLDAQATLERIMQGDKVDLAAADAVIRPVLLQAQSAFGEVCAFGELVNLLWLQRNKPAAVELEQWWNRQIDQLGFSLLCAYRADPFDEQAQLDLDALCSTHSHLIPVIDDAQLERAVIAALHEMVPTGDAAAMCECLATQCSHATAMPRAQAALLALRDALPWLAPDIRRLARRHYGG